MRCFRALILAFLAVAMALPAGAQTVADMEQAWRGWMTRNLSLIHI